MRKELLLLTALCLSIFFGYELTNERVTIDTQHVQIVTIKSGDTLWGIAEHVSHNHDIDVRSVIYTMKELNNLEEGTELKPGSKLQVPSIKKVNTMDQLPYVATINGNN